MSDDRDSPWKEALDRYLEAGLRLLFPGIHARIDWSRRWEHLDTELQQVVRDATTGRRYADRLYRVWLKEGDAAWLLVHIEVQGQVDPELPERVFVYVTRIRDRYGPPVLSLVVLADDDPGWRPGAFAEDTLGCRIELSYPAAKLLDLDPAGLEADPNPFALFVLAHLASLRTRADPGARTEWKWRLHRALRGRGYTREEVLELYRLIDWLLRLPPELERQHLERVERWEREQGMPFITSAEQIGIEKGLEKGLELGVIQGQRASLLLVLETRFGPLPGDLRALLDRLTDPVELAELLRIAATADSLDAVRERATLPEDPE